MSDWLNRCHFGDVRAVLRRMAADGVKLQTDLSRLAATPRVFVGRIGGVGLRVWLLAKYVGPGSERRDWFSTGRDNWEGRAKDHITMPLYAAPQAAEARKPLDREVIMDGYCKTPQFNQFVEAFFAGVNFAEVEHGIGSQP